jgi:hypothetical protein
MLQMIVGFQPDAPAGKLYLDPALPDWMQDLEILDLRVGQSVFDLTFHRDGPATRMEVTRGDANCVIQRSFATTTDRWV